MAPITRDTARTLQMYHGVLQMPRAEFKHRAFRPKAGQGEALPLAVYNLRPVLLYRHNHSEQSRGSLED